MRAQALNKSLHPLSAVITDAEGLVIAASDPRRFPIGVRLPSDLAPLATGRDFRFEAGAQIPATATRVLSYPGRIVGIIHATFDTSHLALERRDVVLALAATNGMVTLLLAVAGWLLRRPHDGAGAHALALSGRCERRAGDARSPGGGRAQRR